jgi:hypothetical protein
VDDRVCRKSDREAASVGRDACTPDPEVTSTLREQALSAVDLLATR